MGAAVRRAARAAQQQEHLPDGSGRAQRPLDGCPLRVDGLDDDHPSVVIGFDDRIAAWCEDMSVLFLFDGRGPRAPLNDSWALSPPQHRPFVCLDMPSYDTDPVAGAYPTSARVGGRPATIPGLRRYDEDDGNAPTRKPRRPGSAAFAQPSSRKPGFALQGSGHTKPGMQVHRARTVYSAGA